GITRFASETRQKLNHFVSIDMVSLEEHDTDKKQYFKGTKRQQVKHLKIPKHIQECLWSQPACANTKLVPGRISLCVGMPVMIHVNSATELAVTKGQEAVVHSWECGIVPEYGKVLDTLFVCLIHPPTAVQITGLPEHAVPLTRTTVNTSVQLPDNTNIVIACNQIEMLPNF
ncbi:hypothetical protein L208DRAFT_1207083, partial [Tricholoma matsutake]